MTARILDDDPVLAALATAPVVSFTDEEKRMWAEAEAETGPALSTADILRALADHPEAE